MLKLYLPEHLYKIANPDSNLFFLTSKLVLMLAIIRNNQYGEGSKKLQIQFFDILKNIELGIANKVQRTINIKFLEGIGFQTDPIRN